MGTTKLPFVIIFLVAFRKDSTKELESIFTDFLSKTTKASSTNSDTSKAPSSLQTNLQPRIVPMDFSLPGLGQAYTSYCLQPAKFDFHELPRSYQFVLSVCSSLVETDTKVLYSCMKHSETHLNRQLTFMRNLEKEYNEETGMFQYNNDSNYVSLVLLCLNFVNTLSSFLR